MKSDMMSYEEIDEMMHGNSVIVIISLMEKWIRAETWMDNAVVFLRSDKDA